MKYAIVLCLAFACTPTSDKPKEVMNESVISAEIEAVGAMLQKDKQRIDSMEKTLLDQM
ncbi:MAG: hypothetical protein QMC70_04860 [Bacteroidia bacterium]